MDEEECPKPGLPAYMGTFADLMSLLMCFFVLLLSFAETDATKFKRIADSMEKAFGVQRKVPATEPPMGTSPIFDKFSPGIPQPTPIENLQQQTTQDDPKLRTFTSDAQAQAQAMAEAKVSQAAAQLVDVLTEELAKGLLQLEAGPKHLTIRIEERGSFGSGTADLNPVFQDVALRLGQVLEQIPGNVSIEGHTDNLPINTARFRSNWDLSAARASSLANALLGVGKLSAERLRVQGHADTRPLVANDTAADRAKNRRVEIVIDLSKPVDTYAHRVQLLIENGEEQKAQALDWNRP